MATATSQNRKTPQSPLADAIFFDFESYSYPTIRITFDIKIRAGVSVMMNRLSLGN